MSKMGKEAKSHEGQTPVLECKSLSISYYTRAGEIPAVVDFDAETAYYEC